MESSVKRVSSRKSRLSSNIQLIVFGWNSGANLHRYSSAVSDKEAIPRVWWQVRPSISGSIVPEKGRFVIRYACSFPAFPKCGRITS